MVQSRLRSIANPSSLWTAFCMDALGKHEIFCSWTHMGRHMLCQSPVGFSIVPAPVCIELGAVAHNLLCPYVIGKQTNSRLFAQWFGTCRCMQKLWGGRVPSGSIYSWCCVYENSSWGWGTKQSPACEGEKAGFVLWYGTRSRLPQSAHSAQLCSILLHCITRTRSCLLPIDRMWAEQEPVPGVVWEKNSLAEAVRAQGPSISTAVLRAVEGLPQQSLLRIGV